MMQWLLFLFFWHVEISLTLLVLTRLSLAAAFEKCGKTSNLFSQNALRSSVISGWDQFSQEKCGQTGERGDNWICKVYQTADPPPPSLTGS